MTATVTPRRSPDTTTVQAVVDAFLSSQCYANPNARRGYAGVLVEWKYVAALPSVLKPKTIPAASLTDRFVPSVRQLVIPVSGASHITIARRRWTGACLGPALLGWLLTVGGR